MNSKSQTQINLSILNSLQLGKIHQASLDVLARTGVVVRNEEAINLLKKAGADVDGERVRIPGRLVTDALATVPKRIQIFDRSGNPAMLLEGKTVYFGTGSDCPSVIDPNTNEHRRSTKTDVGRLARLCDGLENIDFCMSMGIASDASQITSYVHQFDAMVRNTSKPLLFTAHDAADVRDIFDLATVVVDNDPNELKSHPRYVLYNEPISPLFHTPEGLGKMLFAAEHNIPMIYIGSPMMGASAPVTMAGCIAQANAESLSGLVIQQLKKPGAPFIYGADASIMDMRTMTFCHGAPELRIMDIVFADLAHYYGLPLFCVAGATDSKIVDSQAGAEMAVTLLISALNGCNLIHDVGYMESGLCSSMESVVLADELVGMVKRYLSAFEITDDTLALDVIDRIGPLGNFLNEPHTLENYRRDVWFPRFFDRRPFEAWFAGGAEPITEPMRRKGLDILATHQPLQLSSGQVEIMDKVLDRRK